MNLLKSLVVAAGLVVVSSAAYSAPYALNAMERTQQAAVTKSDGSYQEARRTYVRSHYRKMKSGKRVKVRAHRRRY